jgi:hypothetical protein
MIILLLQRHCIPLWGLAFVKNFSASIQNLFPTFVRIAWIAGSAYHKASTYTRRTWTYIYASNRIRTHDPSVRAAMTHTLDRPVIDRQCVSNKGKVYELKFLCFIHLFLEGKESPGTYKFAYLYVMPLNFWTSRITLNLLCMKIMPLCTTVFTFLNSVPCSTRHEKITLPKECTYEFHMILRINSSCFLKQR